MSSSKREPGSRRNHKAAMASDVARLAGVSVSAVSRTFTAGASVSEATRLKVIDAARTLKYRPAQGVKTPYLKGSYIIAMAVAELDDLFYARSIGLMSDLLAQQGYRLLLFNTHGQTKLDPVHRELLRFRCDALILATANSAFSLAEECREFGIPVVMFNHANASGDAASVCGANFLGGRTVAAYLLAAEHRRLAFMSGVDDTSMELEREAGFNSVLAAAGLPRAPRARGLYSADGAAQATQRLLSAKERPDAIFCVNDQMALVCEQVARMEFSLNPGKDISIVGFDNVAMSGWPAFDLTTYSQPIDRMVTRLVELLLGMLKTDDHRGVHEVVPGELIIRGSARVPGSGVEVHKDGRRTWKYEERSQR